MGGPAAVLNLADATLLRGLRRGEPAAWARLWDEWKGPLWSICGAMGADRAQAVDLLTRLYTELPQVSRGWSGDVALCCQLGAAAFQSLSQSLELPAPSGIEVAIPRAVQVPDAAQIRAALDRLDPTVRLTYLVDLYFGCPAQDLAGFLEVDEQALRLARADAAWALIDGGSP